MKTKNGAVPKRKEQDPQFGIGAISHDRKEVQLGGQKWNIGNPELLKKHPPKVIGDYAVGLFKYVLADQFAYYIPAERIEHIHKIDEAKPETGLVKDFEESGFKRWENNVDAEVAGQTACEVCGHQGMDFRGFQKSGSRHAVAICRNPSCRHEFEF